MQIVHCKWLRSKSDNIRSDALRTDNYYEPKFNRSIRLKKWMLDATLVLASEFGIANA